MADTSPKPETQATVTDSENALGDSNPPQQTHPQSDVPVGGGRESGHAAAHGARPSLVGEIVKYTISILILGFGIFVMSTLHGLKKPPKEQVSAELIPMVHAVPAVPYAGLLDKTISGTVVPFREIKVAAEVSGNVISKFEAFEAGNFVKKGTALIEIDPTDYELELEKGLAEVDQTEKMVQETQEEIAGAKRNVSNASNDFRLAKSDHQRNLKIRSALSSAEIDQSKRALLAAQSTLTTCENNLEMMKAKLERMKSTLALTKTQLSRSKLNLKRTIVSAPDDGVIVQEMVQQGDFVRAGDPLVKFEDTSRSEVLCNLTPTDLAWVRNNSPAGRDFDGEKTADNFSPYYLPKTNVSIYETRDDSVIWEGVLERFDGIGRDELTRTIPVRITIKNPVVETGEGQRALVRGMFVKCKIEVQTSNDTPEHRFLSFPAVALRPGNYVWVVSDNKLRKVDVKVIDFGEQLIDEKMTKIVVVALKPGSLESGDAIVTTPIPQPKEGKEVIRKPATISELSSWNSPRAVKFTGQTLDKKLFDIEYARGKIVLLHYWETWCDDGFDELAEIHGKFSDVQVVSCNIDKKTDDFKEYYSKNKSKMAWTQLHAPGSVEKSPLADQLRITQVPMFVLVDAAGALVQTNIEVGDLEREIVRERRR